MFRPIALSTTILLASCSLLEDDSSPSTQTQQDVEVTNIGPVASLVQIGNIVYSQASDQNGDSLTYQWRLASNNSLLGAQKDLDISIFTQYSGVLLVNLDVNDGQITSSFSLNVNFGETANNAPTAAPALSNNIYNANASDVESDQISYLWTLTSNNQVLGTLQSIDIDALSSTYNGEQSVTLTVSDADGSNSYNFPVNFGTIANDDSPVARFTSNMPSAVILNGQPVTVIFNASTSTDDNGITNFAWKIDNTDQVGEIISHTFTQAGTYPISLTVTDSSNQSNNSTVNFVVSQSDDPDANIAIASVDKIIGTTDDTFNFNSASSTINSQNPQYSWSINNQQFNTENAQYQFNTKGAYIATLTIIDGVDSVSNSVEIKVADPIDAQITASSLMVELGNSVSFSPSNPNNDNTSYTWNIDNTTLTTEDIDYTFTQIGTYPVTLTIENNIGLSQSSSVDVSVIASAPAPRILVVSNENLTVNLDIEFDSNPIAYQWSIDSTLYSTKMVAHTFSTSGTYNITLSANYGSGFVVEDSTMVTISADNNAGEVCTTTSNGDPYCNAHFTTDNNDDGWGMENNTSCVYINGAADPSPGNCIDGNFGDDYTNKGTGLSSLAPFPIGLAIPDGTGTSGVSILNNSTRQNILTSDFSQLTVENKMKMSYIEYNFNEADAIVNWAKQNDIGVHGHALVWHHASQLPSWAENPKASFKDDFVESITRTASHFAGKVYSWDVVNEALYDEYDGTGHTDNNGLRNSVYFNQYNGSEYIHEAFRAARAADPNAILYYNDFSTENNQAKTDALVDLIQELIDNDVPIDGVGFQMHVVNSWPNVSDIRTSIQKIVDLDPNLMIKITELDVRINNVYDGDDSNDFVNRNDCLGANSCSGLAAQKARYKEIIEAYLDVVPAHRRGGISIWGVADLDSWLYENNGPNNTPDWPLLFDDNFDKKPAFYGVEEVMLDLASFN